MAGGKRKGLFEENSLFGGREEAATIWKVEMGLFQTGFAY